MPILPSTSITFPTLVTFTYNGDMSERLCDDRRRFDDLVLGLVAVLVEKGEFSHFIQVSNEPVTDSQQKLAALKTLESENQEKMDLLIAAQSADGRNSAELERLYVRSDDIALSIIGTSWAVDYELGQRAIGEALKAIVDAAHGRSDSLEVAARPIPEIVSCALNTVRSADMPTTIGELAAYLVSSGESKSVTWFSASPWTLLPESDSISA